MGLIGVAIFNIQKNVFEISQIILSCRSFSRDVEKLMIYYLLNKWIASNIKYINFLFDKNIDKVIMAMFMLNKKIKLNQNLTKQQLPKKLFLKPNHLQLKDQ